MADPKEQPWYADPTVWDQEALDKAQAEFAAGGGKGNLTDLAEAYKQEHGFYPGGGNDEGARDWASNVLWSQAFAKEQGRAPSEGDWKQHYYSPETVTMADTGQFWPAGALTGDLWQQAHTKPAPTQAQYGIGEPGVDLAANAASIAEQAAVAKGLGFYPTSMEEAVAGSWRVAQAGPQVGMQQAEAQRQADMEKWGLNDPVVQPAGGGLGGLISGAVEGVGNLIGSIPDVSAWADYIKRSGGGPAQDFSNPMLANNGMTLPGTPPVNPVKQTADFLTAPQPAIGVADSVKRAWDFVTADPRKLGQPQPALPPQQPVPIPERYRPLAPAPVQLPSWAGQAGSTQLQQASDALQFGLKSGSDAISGVLNDVAGYIPGVQVARDQRTARDEELRANQSRKDHLLAWNDLFPEAEASQAEGSGRAVAPSNIPARYQAKVTSLDSFGQAVTPGKMPAGYKIADVQVPALEQAAQAVYNLLPTVLKRPAAVTTLKKIESVLPTLAALAIPGVNAVAMPAMLWKVAMNVGERYDMNVATFWQSHTMLNRSDDELRHEAELGGWYGPEAKQAADAADATKFDMATVEGRQRALDATIAQQAAATGKGVGESIRVTNLGRTQRDHDLLNKAIGMAMWTPGLAQYAYLELKKLDTQGQLTSQAESRVLAATKSKQDMLSGLVFSVIADPMNFLPIGQILGIPRQLSAAKRTAQFEELTPLLAAAARDKTLDAYRVPRELAQKPSFKGLWANISTWTQAAGKAQTLEDVLYMVRQVLEGDAGATIQIAQPFAGGPPVDVPKAWVVLRELGGGDVDNIARIMTRDIGIKSAQSERGKAALQIIGDYFSYLKAQPPDPGMLPRLPPQTPAEAYERAAKGLSWFLEEQIFGAMPKTPLERTLEPVLSAKKGIDTVITAAYLALNPATWVRNISNNVISAALKGGMDPDFWLSRTARSSWMTAFLGGLPPTAGAERALSDSANMPAKSLVGRFNNWMLDVGSKAEKQASEAVWASIAKRTYDSFWPERVDFRIDEWKAGVPALAKMFADNPRMEAGYRATLKVVVNQQQFDDVIGNLARDLDNSRTGGILTNRLGAMMPDTEAGFMALLKPYGAIDVKDLGVDPNTGLHSLGILFPQNRQVKVVIDPAPGQGYGSASHFKIPFAPGPNDPPLEAVIELMTGDAAALRGGPAIPALPPGQLPKVTLLHELGHALVGLGIFTPEEFATLSRTYTSAENFADALALRGATDAPSKMPKFLRDAQDRIIGIGKALGFLPKELTAAEIVRNVQDGTVFKRTLPALIEENWKDPFKQFPTSFHPEQLFKRRSLEKEHLNWRASGLPPRPGQVVNPDQVGALWRGIAEDFYASRLAAMRYADKMRDEILINYGNRRGIDLVMSTFLLYHYWPSRTYLNWGKTFLENPEILADYLRIKRTVQGLNQDQPQWLQDKVRIQIPFINQEVALGLDGITVPWAGITGAYSEAETTGGPGQQAVKALQAWGLNPHPLWVLLSAGADELLAGQKGETRQAAESMVPPIARVVRYGTGLAGLDQGQGLGLRDEATRRRVTREFAHAQIAGDITPEQAVIAGWYFANGKAPEDPIIQKIIQNAIAGEVQWQGPAKIFSFFTGVNAYPLPKDDAKVTVAYDAYFQLFENAKQYGWDQAKVSDAISAWNKQYPFMKATQVARMPGPEASGSLAKDILARIAPNQKDVVALSYGIDAPTLSAIYDWTKPAAGEPQKAWLNSLTEDQQGKAMTAVLLMASDFGYPTPAMDEVWQRVIKADQDLKARLQAKPEYISINNEIRIYGALKAEDPAKAKAMLETIPRLSDYWAELEAERKQQPELYFYYGKEPRQQAISLVYDLWGELKGQPYDRKLMRNYLGPDFEQLMLNPQTLDLDKISGAELFTWVVGLSTVARSMGIDPSLLRVNRDPQGMPPPDMAVGSGDELQPLPGTDRIPTLGAGAGTAQLATGAGGVAPVPVVAPVAGDAGSAAGAAAVSDLGTGASSEPVPGTYAQGQEFQLAGPELNALYTEYIGLVKAANETKGAEQKTAREALRDKRFDAFRTDTPLAKTWRFYFEQLPPGYRAEALGKDEVIQSFLSQLEGADPVAALTRMQALKGSLPELQYGTAADWAQARLEQEEWAKGPAMQFMERTTAYRQARLKFAEEHPLWADYYMRPASMQDLQSRAAKGWPAPTWPAAKKPYESYPEGSYPKTYSQLVNMPYATSLGYAQYDLAHYKKPGPGMTYADLMRQTYRG